MKYIKIVVAAAMLLTLTACDGTIDTNNYPLMQPDAEYELDTWGNNSELYEFTPKSNSNITCIVFILDNGTSTSMQCFKKKGK